MSFEKMSAGGEEKKQKNKFSKEALALAAAGLISYAAEAKANNITGTAEEIGSEKTEKNMQMSAEQLGELQKKPEILEKALKKINMQKEVKNAYGGEGLIKGKALEGINNLQGGEIEEVSNIPIKSTEEFLENLKILNPNLENVSANSLLISLENNSPEKNILLRAMTKVGMPKEDESAFNFLKRADLPANELEKISKVTKI